MSFEDLEARIKKFFFFSQKTAEKELENRVRMRTMEVFSRKKQVQNQRKWGLWKQKLSLSFSLVLVVSVLGFLQFPFSPVEKEVIAGRIETRTGPVEVIRGEESFLVRESFDILVGDTVKIGNKGEAKLVLSNQLISIAKNKTQFRVTDKNALFLKQGLLENEVFRGAEIATDRGFVKSPNGTHFDVTVSETGETTVAPNKNIVKVYDLNKGQIALHAGDQVILRSDTQLSKAQNMPSDDLKLSNSQLSSIYSKLVITRTKLLTGVEKMLVNNQHDARRDIASAQKTFVSITQVLQTSRELELARRKNLSAIAVEDVFLKISQKTNEARLLNEIQAVATLFKVLEQNRGKVAFSPQKSGVESFDRYVVLKNLVSLGTLEQQERTRPLLQKYAVNFLRKVQNSEIRIDQITVLNTEIEKLPTTEVAYDFLQQVGELLPPDLAEILEEKVEHIF